MYQFFKRTMDILFSFLGLIILSPLLLIISILLVFTNSHKIIIKQKRVGRYNKIFSLYKFRTMIDIFDDRKSNLVSAKITKLGKFLRNTSLDELPQLLNILVGDMSFIGPRPKTIEETLFIMDKKYIYRNSIRPGLTGLAAVRGRNKLTPKEAFALDLEYVSNECFLSDVKILFSTIKVVFLKEGVNYSVDTPFIPHRDYWQNIDKITSAKAKLLIQEAKEICYSKVKYIGNIKKIDFINFINRKVE